MSESRNALPHATPGLGEMYANYFLDYASYVILERAVPHLHDGLKPVQRRILHALRDLEDGRYNKVANVVGHTMKFHPHGDRSIGDALVQLGQKDLLIDTQGNWGNTLTGDGAAAPRYIEARLTKFALEVVFAPRVTRWALSYDGRNREPVTLPVKFPLVLAQGAEGIAVGLSCRILPHNFNELIDASIAALRNQPFELQPDFPTGGLCDASDYRDGTRGGRVRVRARIETERKRLRITEIPFGTTTGGIMDSIVTANEKGRIKVAKIEDNTAGNVEIIVHLLPGTDPETTRDALYAFTDCEVSIAPCAVVICDDKPRFLSISELVSQSAAHTRDILQAELEVRLEELSEKWHFASLEKIFIENRIYRDIEECETWEAVLDAIDKGLRPHTKDLKREVTTDDITRLTEIRIKRISKYDSFKADEDIRTLESGIAETSKNLRQLTRYAIRWFENLKKKYGSGRERRTELTGFDRVVASQVVVANESLCLDRSEGFAGYALKGADPVAKCSRLDDIIVVTRDGKLTVSRVQEKAFIGKNPAHIAVFKRDVPIVYSMIYRDGRDGPVYAKRFEVSGVTRDRTYELARGTPGTRVLYFAAHSSRRESDENLVRIVLKPALRLRLLEREFLFGELAVKGRSAKGNLVTKHAVDRVVRAASAKPDAADTEGATDAQQF